MQKRILFTIVVASVVGLSSSVVSAITFYSDDFESYAMDGEVSTVGGWTISNTASTVETEAQWHLVDTRSLADSLGLPNSVHFGPATIGGGTTPSYDPSGATPGGLFLISNSDGLPGSNTFPTLPGGSTPTDPALPDNDPWDNRIDNGSYTGASNDMISPSFSTVGASGDVWFHASASANLGDGGQAIFDVDVSTDGGSNWTNVFRRIAPGTGRDFASGDFDQDVDVDGVDFLHQQRLMDWSDCGACGPNDNDIDTNRRNTDQRWSDWEKAFGAYTPVVATVADGNAGGHHGELDINLGAIGGNSDVKVRIRHFEQDDDEFAAIDNIRVDEQAPAGSASQTIFSEDFNSKTLGSMGVYEFTHALGIFGTDSGHGNDLDNNPMTPNFSWGARDRPTIDYEDENEPTQGPPIIDASGRYDVNVVERKNVNHLGHPTAEGSNGEVPFAIIDPLAEPEDSAGSFLSFQSERMHTPILDFTNYSTVVLEWDDEAIIDGNPFLGSVASVVLLEDDDGTMGPSDGDSIINEPDKFGTDFFNPYTPFDQYAGGAFTGGDDPIFSHHRIDITSLVNMATDKSNLYVAWQFVSARTEYWAVDNILITGDPIGALAAVATPEPSTLLLMLFGIPAFATVRRRAYVRYRY